MNATQPRPILTGRSFRIHQLGLIFDCTARGHRESGTIVVDQVTIIGVKSRPFGSCCDLKMDPEHRVGCERRIAEYFPDVVKAALRAQEKLDLSDGCSRATEGAAGQEA